MSLRTSLDRAIVQRARGILTDAEYAHKLLGIASLAITELELAEPLFRADFEREAIEKTQQVFAKNG
jgi:hypothetical protein